MGNKPIKGVANAVDSKDAINKGQLDATVAGYVPTSRTISAGTGLSGGGDLSANRTISLANTAVSAGSYTLASITVDAQGRLTAASSGSVTTLPTQTGNAGKVLQTDGSNASWSVDSAVRARARVTSGTSATCTVNNNVNVASVTQSGGNYSLTFSSALASNDYEVFIQVVDGGANVDKIFGNITKGTSLMTFSAYRSSTGGLQAAAAFDIIVFGGF